MFRFDPDRGESPSATGQRCLRTLKRLVLGATLALGVLWLLSLAGPEPARAAVPNPIDAIQDVLGAGADVVTGGIGQLAVDGFGGIIKALFAWPAKIINRELLAWLVAVPDYAIRPESGGGSRHGSNLAQLGATTSAMAFAALGAVGTVSAIRYWAAGLTGSGGVEALEGLARTVGAALAIVLWPWLFRHAADLANEAGRGLLGSDKVLDDTARVLAAAFVAGVALNILAIVIAIAAALLFLALLVSKIAVSAGTAVVFVGMPLAVMLWPIPELAWIARAAMRMFATVLAIPLAWALCFATFTAVGVDALALKGAGRVVDALIMPLVAVALLWLTVVLPKSMARMALSGAGGGGFVTRTASHVAARRADRALTQTASAAFAGGGGTDGHDSGAAAATARGPGEQPAAGGSTGRQATQSTASLATVAAGAAAGAGTGGAAAAAAPAAQRGGWRPPKGFAAGLGQQGSGTVPGRGLRSPSWQEIRDHVPIELAAAAQRQPGTTRGDVAGAMRALSPDARRGVIGLMEDRGGQIRGQMAHQAARGDIDEPEREAFRTLAAATPEARAHGIRDAVGQAGSESLAAPSITNGATERGTGPAGAGSAAPPTGHEGSRAGRVDHVGGGDALGDGGGVGDSAPRSERPPAAALPDGGATGSAISVPPARELPGEHPGGSSVPPARDSADSLADGDGR